MGARFTINGRDDRWSVSVFGSNLTNKVYSPGSFNQTLGGALERSKRFESGIDDFALRVGNTPCILRVVHK